MGTLRSFANHSGRVINGVLLGETAEQDGVFAWDDSAFPEGWLDENGDLVESDTLNTPDH